MILALLIALATVLSSRTEAQPTVRAGVPPAGGLLATVPAPAFVQSPAAEATISPWADEATELNEQAAAALEEDRPADAVLFLESACKLAPDDEVLTRNLGYAYFMRGRIQYDAHAHDAAAADYRRAADLVPAETGYRLHLASLLLRQYRLTDARTELQRALEVDPESPDGHLLLGDTLNLLDELPAAMDAYRAAMRFGEGKLAENAKAGFERTSRQHGVEKDYRTDTTDTFIIRHPAETNFLELTSLLDRARVEVCNTFDVFPSSRAIVVLYPPEAFREVTGAHEWVGGLFDRKIRLPIADPRVDREHIERSFRHEYTHLLVSTLAPNCPTYVNEGLAQVAEYGRGQGMGRLASYLDRQGLDRESVPHVAELPESFFGMSDVSEVHLGYLVSHAFVDHMVSQHGMAAAVRWARALAREPVDEAYKSATGRTLDHEEELFRELLRTARG